MYCEKIDLYKYFGLERTGGEQGYLNVYLPEAPDYPNRVRPTMLVIGGGGYAYVSSREKECIALAYITQGFAAFTLEYSVAPVRFPAQLIEGAMAMVYIRENAAKLGVKPDKIAAIGFSAGGHLTGMLATLFDRAEVKNALKEKAALVRPDAVVLSYPVITSGEKAHRGSFDNLCGSDNTKLQAELSLETCVTATSSPVFIWATVNDGSVPSENSLFMALAYKAAGVPFELHIFENGAHGLSLATEETGSINEPVQKWLSLSVTWLKNRGFILSD
ncbi:MAG: alpha/beta hydrolase [Clostridia bacterium]|nr:alpha/beta hydrolase [Clostridia bacterium]